jgi:hypothetical protein
MKTSDVELVKVRELVYQNLTVPVWKASRDQPGAYLGEIVRESDLPDDLLDAFGKSQMSAAIPFSDGHYVYDFTGFMDRGGKSWYYDGSLVAAKYLYTAPVPLLCSSCGAETRGRQWRERDVGYGLCDRCATWLSERGEPAEAMRRSYGVEGVHYKIREQDGD